MPPKLNHDLSKIAPAKACTDLVDAIGQHHVPINAKPRIVSLVPSLTELVFDLGLAPLLVGRTGFCIHPAEGVREIPKVGGTKAVNIEKIRKLAPTHVLVNIDENEKPTVDLLVEFVPHIVVTHPLQVQDNPALYQLLGGIFKAESAAQKMCADFSAAFARLALRPHIEKRVLYCIWKDPWMSVAASTYIADMLAQIGWRQIALGDGVVRYPAFKWKDVGDFDAVLLSSEPYRFQENDAQELALELDKPVVLVDGEMLSWYGSRAIQGLDYLQRLGTQLA